MSKSSSFKEDELGPDYFGYYKHLLSELYPQNGECASTSSMSELEPLLGYHNGEVEGITNQNNSGKDKRSCGPVQFFTSQIGGELSDYKKERLQGLLHEIAVCLNHEVDEMFGCILATLQISSDLQEKVQMSGQPAAIKDTHQPFGNTKRKLISPDNSGSCFGTLSVHAQFGTKVYNDIKATGGDDSVCPEAVEKYSYKINEKLSEMEENIEEYLDTVVSKCRIMTPAEQQQLGRKIQKLPGKALDGVVEILQRKNPSASDTSLLIWKSWIVGHSGGYTTMFNLFSRQMCSETIEESFCYLMMFCAALF